MRLILSDIKIPCKLLYTGEQGENGISKRTNIKMKEREWACLNNSCQRNKKRREKTDFLPVGLNY